MFYCFCQNVSALALQDTDIDRAAEEVFGRISSAPVIGTAAAVITSAVARLVRGLPSGTATTCLMRVSAVLSVRWTALSYTAAAAPPKSCSSHGMPLCSVSQRASLVATDTVLNTSITAAAALGVVLRDLSCGRSRPPLTETACAVAVVARTLSPS